MLCIFTQLNGSLCDLIIALSHIVINRAAVLCSCVLLLENWPGAVLRKSRSLTEVWHWESVGYDPWGELIEKEVSLNSTKLYRDIIIYITRICWADLTQNSPMGPPYGAAATRQSLRPSFRFQPISYNSIFLFQEKEIKKGRQNVKSIIIPGMTALLYKILKNIWLNSYDTEN